MEKICIIKLGADGDVIRTISLAKAIKSNNPDSIITWITRKEIASLLQGIECIDKVFTLPYNHQTPFNKLYNFDTEKEAITLAHNLKAEKKFGFDDDSGYPIAFNSGAEYYLNTMFDDELKRNNKKTYQEMMFDVAEIKYNHEFCGISLTKEDKEYANEFVKKNKVNLKNLIGIHMGASSRWPSKVWHPENLKEFISLLKNKGYDVLLFGGPNEIDFHSKIVGELKSKGIKVHSNNPLNTKREFASLVNLCNIMVCSDSFSLHLSLALRKKTIGLFFCTSPNEVEGYGLLKKITSSKLYDFFPEKSDIYNEELVKSISAQEVLKVLLEIL